MRALLYSSASQSGMDLIVFATALPRCETRGRGDSSTEGVYTAIRVRAETTVFYYELAASCSRRFVARLASTSARASDASSASRT